MSLKISLKIDKINVGYSLVSQLCKTHFLQLTAVAYPYQSNVLNGFKSHYFSPFNFIQCHFQYLTDINQSFSWLWHIRLSIIILSILTLCCKSAIQFCRFHRRLVRITHHIIKTPPPPHISGV